MLAQEDSFLRAIREQPDDDTIRLMYADWLTEQPVQERVDRGEFIRLQIQEARLPSNHPDEKDLKNRSRLLLERNWQAWVGPLRGLIGKGSSEPLLMYGHRPESIERFHRGFIETLTLGASTFLTHAAELYRLIPLRNLLLIHAGSLAADLAASPFLADLQLLDFMDYYSDPVDAAGVAKLAQSPHLGRLRYLQLYYNNLGDAGVEALVKARWLNQLIMLNLGNCGIGPQGLAVLLKLASKKGGSVPCPAFPHLIHLDLGHNEIGDQGARALARSPLLRQLSHLGLESNNISAAACQELRASPYLQATTTLNLFGNEGEPLE